MVQELVTRDSFEEFCNMEAIVEFFREELEAGKNRLVELVNEAPESKRKQVALLLLEQEFEICREQGWTFDLVARKQAFPELENEIEQFFCNEENEAVETVAQQQVSAVTQYNVNPTVWQQGGQGALHKGRDEGLGQREVVIKFLKNLKQQNQFHKEIFVTANLEHPGIVAVFAKGTEPANDDSIGMGRPFYAMRLIRGETFDQRVRSFHHGQLNQPGNAFETADFKTLVEVLISVCDTIDYAHSRGVLHCDIKPSNIKCGPYNATFVLDWGSAASFDNDRCTEPLTQSRLSLNEWTAGSYTLQFASPEQLNSNKTTLSPASDIYSIGATLYHLLTNGPPHDQQRIQSEQPRNPRSFDKSMPKALAAITLKAMHPEPINRYASAHDLGQDLKNWLRDEPVSANPDTLIDRVYRFARQHKALTTNGLISLALATMLLMVWFGYRNRDLNRKIEAQRITSSRDSAFRLIEDICEPLAHDSTGDVNEFRRLAGVLDSFSNNYLQEFEKQTGSTIKVRDKLGKAYQFKAYVNYFRFNNATELELDPAEHLAAAIGFLDQAESHFEDSDPAELAATRLLKSRLLFRQLQSSGKDSIENLDLVLTPLNRAIGYFSDGQASIQATIDAIFQANDAKTAVDQLLDFAEAHHLKGELLLTHRGASRQDHLTESQQVSRSLQQAKNEFQRSVDIRAALAICIDFESLDREQKNLVLRDLGRGHGWLGDVEKYLGDLDDAIASYHHSLNARQTLADDTGEDEHRFQLARGWANFATLVRDFGDQLSARQLEQAIANHDPQATGQPLASDSSLEILVIDRYLQNAILIREQLAKLGDSRYRTDLASSWNIQGELYLFAAMNATEPQQREQHLQKVRENVQKLRALFADTEESELSQANRTLIATSYMLSLQSDRLSADGKVSESDVDRVKALLDTEEFGYRNMNYEALFAYCVALQAQNSPSLEKVMLQLIQKENSNDNRMIRHFGKELVERLDNSENDDG